MAKARSTDSPRERSASAPRGSGLGLVPSALLGALAAAAAAFLGAYLAGRQGAEALLPKVDAVGSALVGALTAPEPHWWRDDHDTFDYAYKRARDTVPDEVKAAFPKIPSEPYKKIVERDGALAERNKGRLDRTVGVLPRDALVGLQVSFTTGSNLPDRVVGARVPTGAQLGDVKKLGNDVFVGNAAAGGIPSRVYCREYRTADGRVIGYAYASFSRAALEAAGSPGMWTFLAPLLAGAAGMIGVLAAAKAANGIRSLTRDLEALGRGKTDHRVTINAGGEVGGAQRTLERAVKNLALIQTTGAGDIDEAVEKELSLAAQIHQSLRPADPPRVPGFEVETLFKPGRDIGGDYLDYLDLGENRFGVVIADCGEGLRGVPAAMVMAMTRAYLKGAVDPSTGPADWLRSVNRRLSRDLKSGMAVTAQIAIVDRGSGEVTVVSAGHRPMVFWRQGKTAIINPNGIALGLDIGPVFDKTLEEKKLALQPNDRIVLYTDGVITAKNPDGAAYGEAAFVEAVRRQGGMNSAAFVNFAAGGVDKHLAGAEQDDDLTISTVKRLK